LPDIGPEPSGKFTSGSLWWEHELLHREIIRDYPVRSTIYQQDRDAIEIEFLEAIEGLIKSNSRSRREFSEKCFQKAISAEKLWLKRIKEKPVTGKTPYYYKTAWDSNNKQGGFPKND
jgi:hypothetical protein